jgi:hypothetical protein
MNNDITERDDKSFKESTIYIDENKLSITEDWDNASSIIEINQLVHKIIQSKKVYFSIKNSVIACIDNIFFCKIKSYIKCRIDNNIYSVFPIHRLNPYVELFIRKLEEELVDNIDIYNIIRHSIEYIEPQQVNTLNGFVDNIRTAVKSKEFKAVLHEHQRLITMNHKSLMDSIDNLFSQHSKLLVLRVDLSYKKDVRTLFLNKEEIYQEYEQVKKDRSRFFNNMRSNSLFDNMLGYAWKLQYAKYKGFHYHMIFFFNGSKVQQDVTIAKGIGEYWVNSITQGRGFYYNCNTHKYKYNYCGVGMINYDDTALIEDLKIAVRYITKIDHYAKINAPNIGKTFGKSKMKDKDKSPLTPKSKRIKRVEMVQVTGFPN